MQFALAVRANCILTEAPATSWDRQSRVYFLGPAATRTCHRPVLRSGFGTDSVGARRGYSLNLNDLSGVKLYSVQVS